MSLEEQVEDILRHNFYRVNKSVSYSEVASSIVELIQVQSNEEPVPCSTVEEPQTEEVKPTRKYTRKYTEDVLDANEDDTTETVS